MGSSSSKPARKLAKHAAEPLRVGVGQSQSGPSASSSRPVGATTSQRHPQAHEQDARLSNNMNTSGLRGAEASETKSSAILDDSRDPHLLANLQKLGQVHVPRGKVPFQPSNAMLGILSARQREADLQRESDQQVSRESYGVQGAGQIKNRLSINDIVALLDARKDCRTQSDVSLIAKQYDVDVDVIEQLARRFNSPSVDASSRRTSQSPSAPMNNLEAGKQQDLHPRVDAIWTEPSWSQQAIGGGTSR